MFGLGFSQQREDRSQVIVHPWLCDNSRIWYLRWLNNVSHGKSPDKLLNKKAFDIIVPQPDLKCCNISITERIGWMHVFSQDASSISFQV